MKTIKLLSIICVVCIFGNRAFAQTSSIYKETWIEIDSLELKGKVTSALWLTDSIRAVSRRKSEHLEYLKASVFRWKFLKINKEGAENLIFSEIEEELERLPTLEKSILYAVKATLLEQYLNDNRYKIRRLTTSTNLESDITTWNIDRLVKGIVSSYQQALAPRRELLDSKAGEAHILLESALVNRSYKPTIYDIIAHQALQFYRSVNYTIARPQLLFVLDNEALFGSSKDFRQWQPITADTLVSKYNALKLLQEIETLHQDDPDPTAYIYAQLSRLDFAEQYYTGYQKTASYEKALETLLSHNQFDEESTTYAVYGLVKLNLARLYANHKENIDEAASKLKTDYVHRALRLCEEIIVDYPNSEAALKAMQLQKEISRVSLRIKMKGETVPNRSSRLFLTYENVDSLELQIVKIPMDYNLKNSYNLPITLKEIVQDSIDTYPVVHRRLINLPEGKDFTEHTTEVLLPVLPAGRYFIYVDNKRLKETDSYAFGYFKVTQLGQKNTVYDRKTVYQFYDKVTGLPLKDLPIHISSREGYYNQEGITDALGEFELFEKPYNRSNGSDEITLRVIKGADTLYHRQSIYGYSKNEVDEEPIQVKTELFLDRGIYRPGQTVYFKGVLIKEEDGNTGIVANEKLLLYIDGANGDELLEQSFITNEFGSFSGSFTIPENVLTGEFSIYTYEDDDDESPFWEKVLDDGDYYDQEKHFRVEAYKRPTFEIKFDAIEKAYKPNDSVSITGQAKAFLGSVISQAKGNYTIHRKAYSRYSYYNDNDNGRQLDQGELTTDDKGQFTINFEALYEELEETSIQQFTIIVKITDLNGETQEEKTIVKVAQQNLFTEIQIPKSIEKGASIELVVSNTNLNDVQVSCSNVLRIYKLDTSEKIQYERLTEVPEFQQISKEDFLRMFPVEPYETKMPNEEKGVLVYEGRFEERSQYVEAIATTTWAEGTYILEHKAQDQKGNHQEISRKIKIKNKNADYLPNDQLFEYTQLSEEEQKKNEIVLQLRTSLNALPVFIDAYNGDDRFYKDLIVLDGKEIIRIPLSNTDKNDVVIRLKYAYQEGYFHKDVAMPVSNTKDYLEVVTETFRSNLYPDQKERWSFRIKDRNGKKGQAEALVSMYDIALDKFADSYWNPDLNFPNYNYGFNDEIPRLNNSWRQKSFTTFNDLRFQNKEHRMRHLRARFDRIQLFGLNMQNSKYAYNRYLRELRSKQRLQRVHTEYLGSITGIVLDESGSPLPGASVIVQGTTIGATTDFDGEFSINATPDDTLEISYVGFVTTKIPVAIGNIHVIMEPDNTLEEVVVTAYGVKREKKALGYAVAEIREDSVGVLNSLSVESIRALPGSANGIDDVAFSYSGYADGNWNPRNAADDEFNDFNYYRGNVLTKKPRFKNISIRKKLEETAFFFPQLQTDRKGRIRFSFEAPQLLTQWRFRLLAHNKHAVTGGLEKLVITQKDLNLVPNTPRFLREGDTVVLQAKLANLTTKELQGSAQLQLFDAVTMQAIDAPLGNKRNTVDFIISPKGNSNVSWKLKIPQGISAVTYRMVAQAGNFSDGEENILPVLSNRSLVTETIPFLVRAGEEKNIVLSKLRDLKSTSVQQQSFSFEYMSNPSWNALQSLPYLIEFPYECAEQTFSRLYANRISAKIVMDNPEIKTVFDSWKGDGVLHSALEKNEKLKSILIAETPWLRDAQSETESKKRLALLFDITKNTSAQKATLEKLKQMQNSDGGFPWFSGGRSNAYITRHIIAGFGHLEQLDIQVEASELLKNAITYLDKTLVEQYQRSIANNADGKVFFENRQQLHYLYARTNFSEDTMGSSLYVPFKEQQQRLVDTILNSFNKKWIELSIYDKGLLALVNYRLGNLGKARDILIALKENAVQSEVNGMYWKENTSGWYWYQAPIETHALLMEAFDKIMEDDQRTVEELKIWLLQQKRTSDWKTTKATASAIHALLLTGTPFTAVTDNTSFTINDTEAQERLNKITPEAGTGYRKLSWLENEVRSSLADIRIKNQSESAGYGGMYWQYFEDLDKITASENEVLAVSKSLFLVDQIDSTKPLQTITEETILNIGQTVRVRLNITASSDMEFVHLKDLRASSLEPLDVLSGYTYRDGVAYYRSTRDTATHFFFDRLPKGTYVIEYDLKVNSKGYFSNGTSTIQSMYAPEFSATTSGIRISVE